MRLIIASLTIFFLTVSFFAFATDSKTEAACSTAMLNGSYGFYRTGFTPDGPITAVGIIIFDGNGHSIVRQRISTNGHHEFVVTHNDIKVAADCTTKSFSENGALVATGVVVDNGNGIFFTGVIEGNSAYGVVEKIHP